MCCDENENFNHISPFQHWKFLCNYSECRKNVNRAKLLRLFRTCCRFQDSFRTNTCTDPVSAAVTPHTASARVKRARGRFFASILGSSHRSRYFRSAIKARLCSRAQIVGFMLLISQNSLLLSMGECHTCVSRFEVRRKLLGT